MLRVRVASRCDPAIRAAVQGSEIRREFLAALIAGESGGSNAACRFEKGVYQHLVEVKAGKLSQADILHHRPAHYGAILPSWLADATPEMLRMLATSWGWTQILGYHILSGPAGPLDIKLAIAKRLIDGPANLREAVSLLKSFAVEFKLHAAVDFEELFSCWNTGQPFGKTYDPEYVRNGLLRMDIYRGLASLAPDVGGEIGGC